MSDIVERLRGLCTETQAYQQRREAADEIERLRAIIEERTSTKLHLDNELLRAEIERLRAAAERVCWFDWSDNDDDAVAAIDALRRALEGK